MRSGVWRPDVALRVAVGRSVWNAQISYVEFDDGVSIDLAVCAYLGGPSAVMEFSGVDCGCCKIAVESMAGQR